MSALKLVRITVGLVGLGFLILAILGALRPEWYVLDRIFGSSDSTGSATQACNQFYELESDVRAGIVTPEEARKSAKEIYEKAEDSGNADLIQGAQELLAFITSGTRPINWSNPAFTLLNACVMDAYS